WYQPLGTQTDKVHPSPRNGNIRTVTCASARTWDGVFKEIHSECQPNRYTRQIITSASPPCFPRVSSRAKKRFSKGKRHLRDASPHRHGIKRTVKVCGVTANNLSWAVKTTGGGGALRKGSVTAMGAFPIRNKYHRISKGLLARGKCVSEANNSAMHILLAKFGKMHSDVVKERK
ncbi:hypothetical protein QBC32DRAFT_186555, partial [Pseudoneurospora amorphoporcata]